MLIKYLLDELTHAEQDHSDAMCPLPSGFGQSRAGEASLLAAVTTEELRTQVTCLQQTLTSIIHNELAGSEKRIKAQLGTKVAYLAVDEHTGAPSGVTRGLHPETLPLPGPLACPTSATAAPWCGGQRPPVGLALPPDALRVPEVRNRQGYSLADSWKIPVKDWFEADPRIGHLVPLKDWKLEWYSGALGRVDGHAAKYHQQRVVAQEFQMCVIPLFSCTTALVQLLTHDANRHLDAQGGNSTKAEASFVAQFPTQKGFTAVFHAVQAARKSRSSS